MEHMFDSDDSAVDHTYNPESDLLIQPKDLFGEQWTSNKDSDSFLVFYGDNNDDSDKAIPTHEAKNIIANAQELPKSESRQIVIFICELLLTKVFIFTRQRKRWMKSEPENWN